MKTVNEKTVKLNLKRREVCDLLLALTAVSQESEAEKWKALHNKLQDSLDDFDEKNA